MTSTAGRQLPRRSLSLLLAVLMGLLGGIVLSGCAASTDTAVQDSSTQARSQSATAPKSPGTSKGGGSTGSGKALAPPTATTNLPTVAVSALPVQARQTLELIAAGGPYPYSKDGATFSNREGILPAKARGFYTEYTVITPGSDDRGARRIVAGKNGSRFYTDDHYSSFREVISG